MSAVSNQSISSYIVVADDGRFVQRWPGGGRMLVREYPDATKFSKARATREANELKAVGTACRVVSEEEYASC